MKALDYILANYQQEKYQASLAERAVLRALVHTLKLDISDMEPVDIQLTDAAGGKFFVFTKKPLKS